MPECNEKQEKRKLIDAKIAELKELCPTLLVLGNYDREDKKNEDKTNKAVVKAIAVSSGRMLEIVGLIKCFLDLHPEAKIAMALIENVKYTVEKKENAEDVSKK